MGKGCKYLPSSIIMSCILRDRAPDLEKKRTSSTLIMCRRLDQKGKIRMACIFAQKNMQAMFGLGGWVSALLVDDCKDR